MRVGFSLSPGGLLLPYHLGVLDSLKYNGMLTDTTPVAGASAGAIATATSACSIDSKLILDDTVDISTTCRGLGSARGNLLPLLRDKLETHVDEDRFRAFQDRQGEAVFSYQELFPIFRPVHRTEFEKREEFIDTVCHSSTFPFFSTNWPVALDFKGAKSANLILGSKKLSLQIPRMVVDGFFAVPGDQFGCPDFKLAGVDVDRTVLVTSFPREAIGLARSVAAEDCICPELVDEGILQSADLLTKATQPSDASEIFALYDAGFADAERWCQQEETRARREASRKREEGRKDYLSFLRL